jgi:hypothetical protein
MMKNRKDWVSGFIDGEGCFYVGVIKDKTMKLGFSTKLEFSITQHIRDIILMKEIILFFDCGYVVIDKRGIVQFRIRNILDLATKLIPFLDEYPLLTIKQ